MAKIIYADENGVERSMHVGADRPEIIVGRVKTCDLVTSNLTVSRRHASITWENGTYMLRDLGSANGTFFRKQKVTQVVLEPGEPVFVGSFPLSIEPDDQDRAGVADSVMTSRPEPAPEPVKPPPPSPPRPVEPKQVPRAFQADWKPAASARPAPAAAEPAHHVLRIDELEELLERERRETARLADALYEAESGLVDLKSSMVMIEDENRSMAINLDALDLENAERVREMESLRDDRDRLELEASALRAEVAALRQAADGAGGPELDAARREIEDLRLSNRGYLKRIGKLLEEKERLMSGGQPAPSAAVAAVDELNEMAATALAGLDAAAGAIADSGPDAAETLSEVRLMVAETARTISRLKKDVQELGHQLKDSFNGN